MHVRRVAPSDAMEFYAKEVEEVFDHIIVVKPTLRGNKMSDTEMKNLLLDIYHKDINYWWRLLGEMFEGTDCWTKPYKVKCRLENKVVYISWDNCSWEVEELK